MKKNLILIVMCLLMAVPVFPQAVVYTEDFANGDLHLNWFSVLSDEEGNPTTPMVPLNEPGVNDIWIGSVSGDPNMSTIGCALAGDTLLSDCSMEANIYIEMDHGYNNSIMIRSDTTGNTIKGYQYTVNINHAKGYQRVQLRYYEPNTEAIQVLAEVDAADLPGGAPEADGWYKIKIKAIGPEFWLYWNDEELPGCPFLDYDALLSSGYFGVYVYDQVTGETPVITKVDDIVVIDEAAVSLPPSNDGITGIADYFKLHTNFPNPFNPQTHISYEIKKSDHVNLTVYDLNGRKVKTLVSDYRILGSYTVIWNATDMQDRPSPSGLYVYTLRTNKKSESKKMILLK